MSGVHAFDDLGEVDRPAVEDLLRHAVVADVHDGLELGELLAHLQEPLLEAVVLDERDRRLAVAGEVGDLFGRARVVDRDRGGTERGDAEVDEVEGGDVPHHEDDAIAGTHTQSLEVGGRAGHVVGVVRVGPLDEGAVGLLLAQSHLVGVGTDRVEEAADDRLAFDGLVELVSGDLAHGNPLYADGWRMPIQAEPRRLRPVVRPATLDRPVK